MKKILFIILSFLPIIFLMAYLNLLWIFLAVLCFVFSTIIFLIFRKSPLAKAVLIIGLILCLIIVVWKKQYPMSHDLDTYSKITLPILKVSLLSDAKYIKNSVDTPPQGEIEKDKFNKKYFQYLAHAQTVENVGSALEHGRNVMNKIREIEELNVDVSKLNETVESLDKLIKEKFRGLKDIRERVDSLKSFLEKSKIEREKVKQENLEDYDKNFRIEILRYAMEEEYDKIKQLQDILNAILDQIALTGISPNTTLTAELKEDAEFYHWVLKEEIKLTIPEEISIVQIDATELELENRIKNITQEFGYYYDDPEKIRIQNSPIFRTNPEVKQIVIVNRMIFTDSLNYVPNKLKLSRLRYSLLRWPNPFPANLRVTLNLEKMALPDDFIYFSNINREGTIDKLLLPPHSYYTSGGKFERVYLGNKDVLFPKDNWLKPSYFRRYNNVWIELLPDNSIFRNRIIQKYKAVILTENLFFSLIVLLFSTIIAALVTKTKGNNDTT